jgi:deoxyadenosine/deoxycytidine kinase
MFANAARALDMADRDDLPFVVCIEGNIGCGKTTLLQRLMSEGYTVYMENVAAWEPYLEEMYNGSGSSDMLQLRICADHARIARDIKALDPSTQKRLPNGRAVVFIERWIGTAEHVFMRSASMAEHLTISAKSVRLWNDFVDLLHLRDFRIDAYVYIEAAPAQAHARLCARSASRASERSVAFDYVESIHSFYGDYMKRLKNEGHRVLRVQNNAEDKESFVVSTIQTIESLL